MRKILLSILVAAFTIALVEAVVRLSEKQTDPLASITSLDTLYAHLPHASISGREMEHQMLVHNAALFSTHADPAAINTAYIGTSRTKILRPQWFGTGNAVNGSGNTYNEISYGLLLQAELVRHYFPNIRRVYFESSLLLRRPNHLIVEEDHKKYLPMLQALLPLRDQLKNGAAFRGEVERQHHLHNYWKLHTLKQRQDMRLSSLFFAADSNARIPVSQSRVIADLLPNGERRDEPARAVMPGDRPPSIANDHPKVQRLRNIPAQYPWDGLFDLIALWGQAHHIEIVLFQPPVRSDLYRFQLQYGLEQHNSDLQRVARTYGIPFIDLNRPELHYMDDWSLFVDEDHMATCRGVILLQGALNEGYRQFHDNGTPQLERRAIEQTYRHKLETCG